jgi:hypothetical protein
LASDLMDLCRRSEPAEVGQNASRNGSRLSRLLASMKASQVIECLKKLEHPSLEYEIYPFPTSPTLSQNYSKMVFSGMSFQTDISDFLWIKKLRNLKQVPAFEIIHMVEAMGSRAEELYELGCFDVAEKWFRRVVTAKREVKGYRLEQTLWACLRIPDCILMKGQYRGPRASPRSAPQH